MNRDHRKALEKRHDSGQWYGKGQHGRRVLKEFRVQELTLRGWTLQRVREDASADPPAVRTLWGKTREGAGELLSIDAFVCASTQSAHDHVFELLGNMESDTIERRTEGAQRVGDVAFGLANTMVLFSRANVVVWLRNAGPVIVAAGTTARDVDAAIEEKLGAREGR